jgi:uncharacterized protein YyaL (SSP411 family)
MSRLADQSSPYLLAHTDNLVDWHPWGPEALALAQEQNKPIFLSIGYSACHWCRVMSQESFADAQTAQRLNDNFVCILVDREERPDVDQVYQAAANLMGHSGGWPLSMFLTPQRVPFLAGTYFPKEERAGQAPPFSRILDEVLRTITTDPDQVATVSERVQSELNNLWRRDMRGPIGNDTLDSAAVRTAQRFDIFFGGIIAQQPKFPSVTHLDLLMRGYLRTGMSQFLQVAANSMDNMLLGGLWDHVGGGFFRYAQDERWQVPNFEKTLVDNALMLHMVTLFWQQNRNKLCTARLAELVEFILRDMRSEKAFATSIDSQTDGDEGKYYLWSEPEVDAALMGTFVAKFKAVYNVTREGMFGGKSVLQRLNSSAPFPQSDADEALLVTQRGLMLRARGNRVPPKRNDAILTDWNGMMIAALANAGGAMQNNTWIQAAIEAFDFVCKTLGDGDRLFHSWAGGKRGAPGFADDYAQMSVAAIALFEATGEKRYLERAKAWTRVMNEHFWDADHGGYCYTSNEAAPLIVRSRMIFDQPMPSSNAQMIKVLSCLNMATGDTNYADRINQLVGAFAGESGRVFISMPSYFAGLEFAVSSLQLAVVGPPSNAKTHELVDAILGCALPNRFLMQVAGPEDFPDGHPLRARGMQNGQPTAYVVQRGQVSAPITNAVTLAQMLQLPAQRPQAGARPQ